MARSGRFFLASANPPAPQLSAVGDDASMTPLSYTLPEPVDIPAVPDVLAEPEPAAEE